jgi:cysteine desulfurase / selenocysteine lyase
MDCDFLVFSGHKLYAETGIGVLYGREEWLKKLPPYQGGGGMVDRVTMKRTTYAEPPLRFEAGTPNYVGAVSLATALDYMTALGLNDILRHEESLTAHMLARVQEFKGLRLYGGLPSRVPLFSFNLDGIHHFDAGQILDKMGIAVRAGSHCAEPLMRRYETTGMIRASLSFYNTLEEIDLFFQGLEKVVRILS